MYSTFIVHTNTNITENTPGPTKELYTTKGDTSSLSPHLMVYQSISDVVPTKTRFLLSLKVWRSNYERQGFTEEKQVQNEQLQTRLFQECEDLCASHSADPGLLEMRLLGQVFTHFRHSSTRLQTVIVRPIGPKLHF